MSKFIVMSAIEVPGQKSQFESNAVGLTEAKADKEAKRRTAAEKKAGNSGITWFKAPDMSEMIAAAGLGPKPARKPRAKKEVIQLTDDEATALLDNPTTDLATAVKETKKRKASAAERDETGKVVRTGRNLSGNQPFRAKLYYYDLEVKSTPDYDKAFNSAPMQVRLIMKHMEEEGITTADDAMRGGEIAGSAINSGKLQSKIEPAALFAYYRRVMERLGLVLAVEG